jgi:hypothetical protein
MHAATQEPRMVDNHDVRIVRYFILTLDHMDPSELDVCCHFRDPNTASIAAFIFSMVNGFASTLLAPRAAAF